MFLNKKLSLYLAIKVHIDQHKKMDSSNNTNYTIPNTVYQGDRTAIRLQKEKITLVTSEYNGLGSGDNSVFTEFLLKDEADQAFEKLLNGEIKYQQWHHMPEKKKDKLVKAPKPLSRLKIAITDRADNGLIPHYRFPVNSQSQHGTHFFDEYPTVKMIRDKIAEKTGIKYNNAVVLLYRDGKDCIGFHKDKTLDLSDNHPIASVSLGQERSYLLRDDIRNPTQTQEIMLKHGTLLLLGPKTNQEWYHSIPLDTEAEIKPRISLTFRMVETFIDPKTEKITGKGEKYSSNDWPTEIKGAHVQNPGPLLNYWFGKTRNENRNSLWWHGVHPEMMEHKTLQDTDEYIKNTWGEYLETYLNYFDSSDSESDSVNLYNDNHPLRHWLDTVEGKVALMILFDQFPRNVYRGTSNAFVLDSYAVNIARDLLENHFDELNTSYLFFCYVTLMHDENEASVKDSAFGILKMANDLRLLIDKYEQEHSNNSSNNNKNDSELENLVAWQTSLAKSGHVALEHLDIIKNYGRYCHRNKMLGRVNTEAEKEFLSRKKLPTWIKNAQIKRNYKTKVDGVNDDDELDDRMEANKKLKILVLHSNRQTSHRFKVKTEKVVNRVLKDIVEFYYCDAPHVYHPSGEIKHIIQQKDMIDVPNVGYTRSWWNASDDPKTMIYQGLEESIQHIDSLFRNERFDGVFGFSQGGSLAGILAGLVDRHRKGGKNPVSVENISKHLKFVIMISGFYCRDTRSGFNDLVLESLPKEHSRETVTIKKDSIDIPSFHSWGMTDKLVDPWRSEKLSEAFSNKVVVPHLSEHFIRAIKYWPIKNIHDWLIQFLPEGSFDSENNEDIIFQNLQEYFVDSKSFAKIFDKFQENSIKPETVIAYSFKQKIANSDQILNLIISYGYKTTKDTLDVLTRICRQDSSLWETLIELDTLENPGQVNDSDQRSLYRDILVKLLAKEIAQEYNDCIIHNKSSVPSRVITAAPSYNATFKRTRLFSDLAFELSRVLNIFDEGLDTLDHLEGTNKYKFTCYLQYKRVIAEMRQMLNDTVKIIPQKKHIPRETLEVMLQRPVSDYILNPRAEPVDISSKEMMQPLYDYLQSSEEHMSDTEAKFIRGTVCTDGRLDLCKQVIGPCGVDDLFKSLEIDSSLFKPKVQHLLLGNNVCGNNLGKAVGKFIKSGKSALTSWYIAGNDMDEEGIKPVCEALYSDRQVRQLWLKRNPIRAAGVPHITKMLQNNDYLQILDLTNTGLMDNGAISLLKGGLSSITHLYLGANGLTVETCKVLSDMLHKTKLVQICLGCNRLGDEGVEYIAQALMHPECKLKSLEIASCAIGVKGAQTLAKAFEINKTLVCLNIGFLKSTNDLSEIPNVLENEGGIAIAKALEKNKTLRSIDIIYTAINQDAIAEFARVLSEHNNTLIHLNIEQFGVPYNELTRELIRSKIEKNKNYLNPEKLQEIENIINPTHLEEIKSVYRIQ